MKIIKSGILALLLLGVTGASQATVMNFGSGVGTTNISSASYSQGGLTMTPLDTGVSTTANHWDWFRDDNGATSTDWHAGIHTGNNGEEVRFDYSGGGTFSLLSILIEGIIFDAEGDNVGGLTGTFTSSAGGAASTSSAGIVDFTAVSGFSNITWFKFSMPLTAGQCTFPGTDCSTMMFDDVTFHAVPTPATFMLFGLGLTVLRFSRRKTKV